jgi:hypothetical protein
LNGDGYFSGGRLLVSDERVVLLLLGEARDQAAERMFGVSRDKSFLVTMIALGMLASAVQSQAEKIAESFKGPNPSVGDAVVATAMAKAVAHGIAGDWSRDSPLFGTLAVISVLGLWSAPCCESHSATSELRRIDSELTSVTGMGI